MFVKGDKTEMILNGRGHAKLKVVEGMLLWFLALCVFWSVRSLNGYSELVAQSLNVMEDNS